jgi:hypothetical protein
LLLERTRSPAPLASQKQPKGVGVILRPSGIWLF